MTRVIEAEKEYKATPEKAIEKFFKKFPALEYWKETFEYILENGESFFSDYYFDTANRVRNPDWAYALHLDINEDYTYICVIERA